MVSMPRWGCHGKPGEVVLGALVAEVVEQQKRVELVGVAEPECAAQLDAGALDGGLGLAMRLTGRMDMVPHAFRVMLQPK